MHDNRRAAAIGRHGAVAFLLAAAMFVTTAVRAQTADAKALQLGISVSGVVRSIAVADGAHVSAGDVILQIDCRPLEGEISVREANLRAATAAFERIQNGSRPDEIAIGEANVGVAAARAEEAQAAYARLSALTEGVSITRAVLLQARRDARVTAAQLEDAKKRLALLLAGSRAEDISEAAARRDAAVAGLTEARAQLDQCSLRAPVAGTVRLSATLGQYFSAMVPATVARLTPD